MMDAQVGATSISWAMFVFIDSVKVGTQNGDPSISRAVLMLDLRAVGWMHEMVLRVCLRSCLC